MTGVAACRCVLNLNRVYVHISLMVSRNTTLVPSLGLRIGPACEAGLIVGMQRERMPPQRIKIKDKDKGLLKF